MKYQFTVEVLPRDVVLDVQGRTIQHSLVESGYVEIKKVKAGKFFVVEVESESAEQAEAKCQQAAQQFLFNPLIETLSLQKMKPS